jgi:hypothetical protein
MTVPADAPIPPVPPRLTKTGVVFHRIFFYFTLLAALWLLVEITMALMLLQEFHRRGFPLRALGSILVESWWLAAIIPALALANIGKEWLYRKQEQRLVINIIFFILTVAIAQVYLYAVLEDVMMLLSPM